MSTKGGNVSLKNILLIKSKFFPFLFYLKAVWEMFCSLVLYKKNNELSLFLPFICPFILKKCPFFGLFFLQYCSFFLIWQLGGGGGGGYQKTILFEDFLPTWKKAGKKFLKLVQRYKGKASQGGSAKIISKPFFPGGGLP